MFTRRSQRKVPKGPRRDGISLLIDQVAADLAAHGTTRRPAGPWIAAALLAMKTAMGGGWTLPDTPEEFLAPMLAHRGWTWRWEGDDLVIDLPGWTAPAPVIVAIQPGLFDSRSTA